MGDLADLIFSHPHMGDLPIGMMQENNNNGETSRKRLHEKASDLACMISFSNSQHSAMCSKNHHNDFETTKYPTFNNFEPLIIPKAEANSTISFWQNINIGGRRTGEQAQEHLLAERNRRRKIAKLFVSLASLLPALNKKDKASILEGACNLIRKLRERAETVQVEDSTAPNYEHHYSSIDTMKSSLPQVEVRSLEEELLITILYCKKQQQGIIDEILTVIQSFHLTIKNSNFMPFGSTSMHVTVIAQMNAESYETTDYLAEKLRLSIIKV